MKRLILIAIIALNLVSIPIGVCAQEIGNRDNKVTQIEMEDYISEYNQLFNILEKGINDIKPTGNPDLDYLKMVEPVQIAIMQLSKAVTKYSTNPELIKVSTNIREEYEGQGKEIAILFEQLSKGNKSNQNNSAYFKEYKAVVDKMLQDLKNLKLTDNVESNYLMQIDILDKAMTSISEVSKKYLKDDLTKKIADNIIKLGGDQLKKIDILIKDIKE